jgi:hypothetical protein
MSKSTVLITGSTGHVGMYLALFFARLGIARSLYLVSSDRQKVSTILHNTMVVSLMHGCNIEVEGIECDLLNPDRTAEHLLRIKPSLIIHCAALFSLYPFFPALRKRQRRMNFIAGFSHTLPKDLALLWPLMRAVKEVCPMALVVNLAAPDTGNAILHRIGLSPTIGAGTIDSTVQGIRLAIARKIKIKPSQIDVRMICHHAIRRFSPDEVPFVLRIFHDQKEITTELDAKELICEAVDVSGVETMSTPVSSNAPITAASAVETSRALLSDTEIIRHGAGLHGQIGGTPVRLGSGKAEIVLPEGIGHEEALRINEAGMKMDGVEKIDQDATVTFTERERYWLREGMGLMWGKMRLEDALPMAEELKLAYQRLKKEEMA